MALDFPASPTDGQIYDNYYWDNTNSVWRLLGDSLEVAADFSNTATGTYTDGFDYKYVSFTSDGTLTVTRGGYADVLLVGGGGGGGLGFGAGGGAGGMLYIENAYIPAGSLDVVVGAGGVGRSQIGGNNTGRRGENGHASSLYKYFAPGGGGGGCWHSVYGATTTIPGEGGNGGSGGATGGSSASVGGAPAGEGVPTLGNDGAVANQIRTTGGGGGAGEAGHAPTAQGTAGAGGDGATNSITGSAVTSAGGGGGSSSSNQGAGGSGGGADGTYQSVPTPATANTGGGGGGVYDSAQASGGFGGSGIVIVRVRTNS